MRQPRVSILLPVYNAAAHLVPCLESLSRQTWTDYEVVIVDDGSTDSSPALLEAAAAADHRLRLLHCQHEGLIHALNLALDASRGDLVARMDADDVAHPRRLELQVAALSAPNGPDVVSCLVRHFPGQSLGEGFRIYEQWLNSLVTHADIARERFIECPVAHPSITTRRGCLTDAGGYRERGWPEDYDLWLRLLAAGCRFAKVPKVLHLWRQHEDRLTRTDGRYSVERFLACKAHHLARGPLTDRSSVVIWGAGQTGRRLSKHLKRLGAPIVGFIDIDRRKIGRTLRGFPIHPPTALPALLGRDDPPLILSAVSSRGARRLIRRQLQQLGLVEAEEFWCAA